MSFCDIAFMGGGVRGIAFAGAISALENAGFVPRKVVGTSAGAIVATLVAVGFSSEEMKKEMENLDYLKFKSKDHATRGLLSEYLHLRKDFGIDSADFFEDWMSSLLKKKGIITFGDLEKSNKKRTLQVTASDIGNKRLLVLPQDLRLFGLNPLNFSIAKAVRMSMSIPIFYEPFKLQDAFSKEHLIVDGGLFCNYPIWLLDNGCKKPGVPVFGMRFVECSNSNKSINQHSFTKFTDYIKFLLSSILDSTEHGYARTVRGDIERTINISVCVKGKNISATDFNLDKTTANALFNNGLSAGNDFLKTWDFDKWLAIREK